MDFENILILIQKELRDALRNRWFLLYAVAFAGLSVALAWFSVSGTGSYGVAGFGRTTAGLINLILLIVPLMGLTLGALSLAGEREKGTLVLFHVTPEATWSNLPISGSFVEMLRRLVQLSRNQGATTASAEGQVASLAPYRMIAANGALVPPGPDAGPLPGGVSPKPVTIENPPGLYGGEEGVLAHNLLQPDAAFAPLARMCPPRGQQVRIAFAPPWNRWRIAACRRPSVP